MSRREKAVFLDKDGTLVEDVPYNVGVRGLRLTRGAAEGLRLLQHSGYRLIVVSNQGGVARRYFREEALLRHAADVRALLREHGIALDGFYWCPHDARGTVAPYARTCACRKPGAGLIIRAASRHGVSLDGPWMVGDILDDVEAGRRAGCRALLLDRGHETEWRMAPSRRPHAAAPDLLAAATQILDTTGGTP